jgi:flagellar biogenesis protein FliO
MRFFAAPLALTLLFVASPCVPLRALDPASDIVLTPSAKTATAGKDSATGNASSELRGPALLAVTAVILLGAYIFIRRTKNKLGRLSQSAQGAIEVCRTRSLGNKQFLVVVQVEGRRMLLGMGPTFITKLSDLEAEDFTIPFERKGADGKTAPADQPPEAPANPSFHNLMTRINDSFTHKDGGDGRRK